MTINAVFPLIEFAIFWAMRWFARYRDTGLLFVSCSKKYDVYKTKTHMIQQYLDTWMGPPYEMHFKYAAIMNIVYITLMFGIGLPLLFPLAVLALTILYVSEKLMLYYAY